MGNYLSRLLTAGAAIALITSAMACTYSSKYQPKANGKVHLVMQDSMLTLKKNETTVPISQLASTDDVDKVFSCQPEARAKMTQAMGDLGTSGIFRIVGAILMAPAAAIAAFPYIGLGPAIAAAALSIVALPFVFVANYYAAVGFAGVVDAMNQHNDTAACLLSTRETLGGQL